MLSSEQKLVVWVHARDSLVVVSFELRVEVEDLLEPHVLRVLVVDLRVDANVEVVVDRDLNLNFLCECAQSLIPENLVFPRTLPID